MMRNIRDTDLALFENFRSRDDAPAESPGADVEVEAATPDLGTVIPAFMLSELRRGFEIGFLILLPFLVIDLVVATVTMSMGMMNDMRSFARPVVQPVSSRKTTCPSRRSRLRSLLRLKMLWMR